MRKREQPAHQAAATKSRLRTCMVVARATTAKRSHSSRPRVSTSRCHRAAEQADDGQRHQHDGDRQPRGDGEQHGIVDPAAQKAAQHADGDADQGRHDRDRDADQHGNAAAPDQAREVVAAELVGAQQVVGVGAVHPERRQQALAEVLGEGIVRHQQRGEDRADHGDAHDERADPGADALPAALGAGRDRHHAHGPRSLGSSTAFIRSASMVSAT